MPEFCEQDGNGVWGFGEPTLAHRTVQVYREDELVGMTMTMTVGNDWFTGVVPVELTTVPTYSAALRT